ncbi:MAG: hypothetical protein M9894_23310 [Planctomycetes bacterium]|nr:hypothetical protein [Planctomycetota bacterium]
MRKDAWWIANGALAALLTLCGPAAAQDPRPRERARTSGVELARGESVPLGVHARAEGAQVERLRFSSPAAAQEFLTTVDHWVLGHPVAGELRGDQVVLVHGDMVRDAARTRAALDAAWSVAPAAAEVDVTFAHLGGDDLAVTTRLPDGPLRRSIDAALAAIHRSPGPGMSSDPRSGEVRFDSGFHARVRSDGDGAMAVTSSRPGGVDALEGYLKTLQPPRRTVGAAGVVRRLFER